MQVQACFLMNIYGVRWKAQKITRLRGQLMDPAEVGGEYEKMAALGLPLINTIILLTSGFTITKAHHALLADHRKPLKQWLAGTIALRPYCF